MNGATLTVTSSIFNNDSAANGGAIGNDAGATATVTNSAIKDDSASDDGGGVFVEGTVTLNNCNISSDTAGNGGGGVCTDGGTANLNDCTVSNDSGVIASGQDRGGGAVTNSGGWVNLKDCEIFDNADEGLWNEGIATVSDSTFSNDSTVGSGGAIGSDSAPGLTATLNVSDCTFNNDSAAVNGGAVQNGGSADFSNCSFANNYAGGGGGAIWNQAGDSLNVDNCTIATNSAASGTGGGIWNQGTLTLSNTIVAENTAGQSGRDVNNAGVVNAEHDLIGNGTDSGITKAQGGNIVGKGKKELNPLLGPLKDNGGPTATMALSRKSPAVGHADDALAPLTDERGQPRTNHFGLQTDIGAYEYESPHKITKIDGSIVGASRL